jgi:hypothetical protein
MAKTDVAKAFGPEAGVERGLRAIHALEAALLSLAVAAAYAAGQLEASILEARILATVVLGTSAASLFMGVALLWTNATLHAIPMVLAIVRAVRGKDVEPKTVFPLQTRLGTRRKWLLRGQVVALFLSGAGYLALAMIRIWS